MIPESQFNIHKIRLGRLAMFILTHKIPAIGTADKYAIIDASTPEKSMQDWVEISDQLQTCEIENFLCGPSGLTQIGFLSIVPFALSEEFNDYLQSKRITEATETQAARFLFGKEAPWQIREFVMGVNARFSKYEIICRIIKVMNKGMWDDSHWLDTLNKRKRYALFKFRRGVEKSLIHTMALVENLGMLETYYRQQLGKILKE